MLKLIAMTALAAGAMAGPGAARTVETQTIHAAVQSLVASQVIPGAIVLVRVNDKPVFEEAAGQADGYALKPDAVFWVASMTKPLVATSVLMLVDEGKVRLDDPVTRYIPQFSKPRRVRSVKPGTAAAASGSGPAHPDYVMAPAVRALTVRDVITMTAGLQTIGVPNDAIPAVTDDDTVASYVAKLGDAPLDFQPGSRWAYSNATEFEILVRVVEVASGLPYAQFVQQRLFAPLDMPDSHFGVRDDLRDRLAPLGQMAQSPLRTGRFTSGSAGLWTTARDYSHFAQMLLDGGEYHGRRLLKAATLRRMSSPQIGALRLGGVNPGEYGGLTDRSNPGVTYGLGLITDNQAAGVSLPTGSFGWDGVGSRRFWVDPKDKTVIVMLIPGGDYPTAQRRIEQAVMRAVEPAS